MEEAKAVEEKKEEKKAPYVHSRMVRKAIVKLERQEVKLFRRMERIKMAVLRGREQVQRLRAVLKEREANANNQLTQPS